MREIADPLHIADHARQVIDVLALAFGACLEVTFVDMAAVVADRIGNVEGEIVAALLRGYAQQLAVLLLAQVLFEVHVQR